MCDVRCYLSVHHRSMFIILRSPLLQCGRHRYGERFSGGGQLAGKSAHPHGDQPGQPGFHGRKFHRRGRLHELQPDLHGHRNRLHAPNHRHLCGRRDTFYRRGYRHAGQAGLPEVSPESNPFCFLEATNCDIVYS